MRTVSLTGDRLCELPVLDSEPEANLLEKKPLAGKPAVSGGEKDRTVVVPWLFDHGTNDLINNDKVK